VLLVLTQRYCTFKVYNQTQPHNKWKNTLDNPNSKSTVVPFSALSFSSFSEVNKCLFSEQQWEEKVINYNKLCCGYEERASY